MNYELCKKLKDAGFPQNSKTISFGEDIIPIENPNSEEMKVSIPTLSELIEACGNRFSSLTLLAENPTTKQKLWQSRGEKIDLSWNYSPEEAVANLWLALQDNKVKV
jgi:hypothetical protein